MLKRLMLVQSILLAALAAAVGPSTSAEACGFMRVAVAKPPSYGKLHVAQAGKIYIYGNAIDSRLEYALRKSGHTVKRTTDQKETRQADVVLAEADCVDVVQQDLKGSKAVLVVVLKASESSGGGRTEYTIRREDNVPQQMATLEQAVQAAHR